MTRHTMQAPVNVVDAFERFDENWSPRTLAAMNDYQVRVVKVLGEFVWHSHEDTDELFLVIDGSLTIEREGDDPVALGPCDLFVVPKGVRHRPVAPEGARLLLIEPADVVNTGDAPVGAHTNDAEWLDR